MFKTLNLEVFFTDGSSVVTDLLTIEEFKKMVDSDILGTQFRKANEQDYLDEYEMVINLTDNINESDFFDLKINGKIRTIYPEKIIKINRIINKENNNKDNKDNKDNKENIIKRNLKKWKKLIKI